LPKVEALFLHLEQEPVPFSKDRPEQEGYSLAYEWYCHPLVQTVHLYYRSASAAACQSMFWHSVVAAVPPQHQQSVLPAATFSLPPDVAWPPPLQP
jgi:hypothetical protein